MYLTEVKMKICFCQYSNLLRKSRCFGILMRQLSIQNLGEVPVFQINIKILIFPHTHKPHVPAVIVPILSFEIKRNISSLRRFWKMTRQRDRLSRHLLLFSISLRASCFVQSSGQIPIFLLLHNSLFIHVCISIRVIFIQDKSDLF